MTFLHKKQEFSPQELSDYIAPDCHGLNFFEVDNGLRDLLPSGAMTEGTVRAEAADRDIDDARSVRRQFFRPEAQFLHDAGAIALREHISGTGELFESRSVIRIL